MGRAELVAWLAGGGHQGLTCQEVGPVAPEGRTGPHWLGLPEMGNPGARPSKASWQNFLQGVHHEEKEPGVNRWQGAPHRCRRDPTRPLLRFWPMDRSAAGLSQAREPGPRSPCPSLTVVTFTMCSFTLGTICPALTFLHARGRSTEGARGTPGTREP